MDIKYIEHIGIAVKSIEDSLPYYENILGLKCYSIEEVKDQKVKTAFFKIGQTKLELLEATDPESPIAKFIDKRGEGIHHMAYCVDSCKETLDELKIKDVRLIDQEPRKGAEGLNIGFVHPKATGGVLTEICDDPKNNK